MGNLPNPPFFFPIFITFVFSIFTLRPLNSKKSLKISCILVIDDSFLTIKSYHQHMEFADLQNCQTEFL